LLNRCLAGILPEKRPARLFFHNDAGWLSAASEAAPTGEPGPAGPGRNIPASMSIMQIRADGPVLPAWARRAAAFY